MVSIIKNQLLKHLSRFTKNLSADKINLSTFKGEGELSNLELDEIVLTDLLELPSWLRLTNAWCNKVSFRIQWTKLKSVPIFLSLDEVHIDVETCEDLRSMSSPQGISSYAGPAKYSFIHKVIDGITVAVNTVLVTFKSPAFIASVQMNRIMVESKSATWQRCDLRTTRVKDPDRGQLLIFKELLFFFSFLFVLFHFKSVFLNLGKQNSLLSTESATCRHEEREEYLFTYLLLLACSS